MHKITNKQTIISILCATLSTMSQAGTLGDIVVQPKSAPYVSGEGSYTWNSINTSVTRNVPAALSKNQWGGRLAFGMWRDYIPPISFNAEFGGGYYGNNTVNNAENGYIVKRDISGYDILAGVMYRVPQLFARDTFLFLNGGAMVQNVKITKELDYSKLIPGGTVVGNSRYTTNLTGVLPEIKVGALFNLIRNLDVSLSYLHVFGSSCNVNNDYTSAGGITTYTGSANILNPTLDSFLFGLRYNFVP